MTDPRPDADMPQDSAASRPKFRRESPEQRREQLVEATLRVIAAKGVSGATVREISAEAGVAFSLIRHHFKTKEDLLYAAYAHHMRNMSQHSLLAVEAPDLSLEERLDRCIRDTLSPPVTDADAMQIWAGFIQMVPRDPRMRQIHKDSYLDFRDALRPLIREALSRRSTGAVPDTPQGTHSVREPDADEVEQAAIACNALLDGLWLEGSMLPDMLPTQRLIDVARKGLFAILGLGAPPAHPA